MGYLGAGVVLGREGGGLQVRLADARASLVTARLALAFPYLAEPGDELLVIGRGDQHFVIGVLSGSGRAELAFRGDVALKALGGTLELAGDHGVKVRSDEVTIHARRLRTFADSVHEKSREAYRWVRERLTERAGKARRVVEGEDYSQAETRTMLAKDVVKIDGGSVQLGH
jgi:hypothetical protein